MMTVAQRMFLSSYSQFSPLVHSKMMRRRPSTSGVGYDVVSSPRPSQDYYGGYRGPPPAIATTNGAGMVPQSPTATSYGGSNGSGSAANSPYYGGFTSPGGRQYPSKPKKATTPTKTVFGGGSFGFHNNLWIPALVLMLLWGGTVIALWMNVRGKYSLILSELSAPTGQAVQEIFSNLKLERDSIEREMSRRMLGKEMELKTQLEKIIEENTHLEQEMGDLRENHGELYNEQKESRMIRRADALVDHMWRLEEAIRKESHRTILERFGPGPHEVEFRFKIDGTDRSFVVEMAPVDEVPHAIHLFMEQVEHGLWNGCYFYLNGPHIVQVGPRLSEQGVSEGNERARIAPFKARGLDQLSFPDYSDNYPHVTWTVGYTGRPGGIDWYINKIDNSKLHGRGGQVQHALKEHGDPCFGKVTRGQMDATVLFRQPIYGDGSPLNHFFKDPIQIISATILTKRPEGAVDAKPAIEDPVRASEQERPRPEMPKIDHAAEP